MSDDPGALRKVAWQELFPVVILWRALRLAMQFRVLLLAALGIVGTTAGWMVIAALLSSPDPRYTELTDRFARWPWGPVSSTPFSVGGPAGVAVQVEGGWGLAARFLSPPVAVLHQLSDPIVRLFAPEAISLRFFLFLLLCALWALVVWSLFGGAISRIAAVALARDERLTWGQALDYARSKWLSYFTAPLYPIFGALVAALPLVLIGLLLRFSAGTIVAGVLWPIVILLGVLMAVLLVGLFFGWPLMWATISTEGTDSFDALSSSYAYVYQRPLHYFLYVVVAALLAALGWAVVSLFATAVIDLGNWAVSWGSGQPAFDYAVRSDPAMIDDLTRTGGTLIRFWIRCVEVLALAFVSAYFWTASTAIYFLLRWHVDATEFDEVVTSKEDESYGLPPLKRDAAGVPDVADGVRGDNLTGEPGGPAEPT